MSAPAYQYAEPDAPCDIRDAPTAGSDRALIQQLRDAVDRLLPGSDVLDERAITAGALAVLAANRRLGDR